MRITCAYSGLKIQVTHFPGSLDSRECYHPVFCIPQKHLLGNYLHKWCAGELTDTDAYLLYLALFNSTDLVEFRTPAVFTPHTPSIVANNMESLARIIGFVNIIQHPGFVLPHIVITKETCDLANSPIWIQDWMECFKDFQDGNIASREQERMVRRENLLHNFIKDVNKPINHYAKILADWAAASGEFPSTALTLEPGKTVSTSEYWKSIIVKCCKAESIFSIPQEDLECVIRWCEDHIPHGSTLAYSLMELLRAGLKRQVNYLGLGDLDFSNTTFRIIPENTGVEEANRQAMIDSAPKEPPSPHQYPSKLAYLRAKLKYDMAVEYYKQLETATAINSNTEIITLDDGKEI